VVTAYSRRPIFAVPDGIRDILCINGGVTSIGVIPFDGAHSGRIHHDLAGDATFRRLGARFRDRTKAVGECDITIVIDIRFRQCIAERAS